MPAASLQVQPSFQKTIATSDWITPNEVPDPTPLPKVVGWRLLVRPVSNLKKETKGGIIMPDTLMDEIERSQCVGRVLIMGNGCYAHSNYQGDRWCEVGEYICYNKFMGTKYLLKGVKVTLLDDKDVLMVLTSPNDIDPAWNLTHY